MRYLDDYTVGEVERYGRYEVERDEVIEFASKYDPQPFHLDDAAAAANPIFGRLAASGWHTAGMAMAMRVASESWNGDVSVGGLGIDELRWLKPVYPGDVLRCESEVLEVRPSRSKPEMGTLRARTTVFNQHDEPVMTFIPIVLMKRRNNARG